MFLFITIHVLIYYFICFNLLLYMFLFITIYVLIYYYLCFNLLLLIYVLIYYYISFNLCFYFLLFMFLQVVNDTTMPISLHFKKTLLESLSVPVSSLGPLSSPSNPFDKHLCLVTLQPDERYPVPLLVAYHSALFIQPAATE